MDESTKFKEYKRSSQDKTSVWQHFLRSPDGAEAKCKLCKKILKISGSTSPLHKHLKIHNIDLKQGTPNEPTATETRSTPTPSSSGTSQHSQQSQQIQRSASEPPMKKMKLTDYFPSNDSMEVAVSKLAALDGFAFNVFCTSITLRMLFTKSGYKLPESPHTIKKNIVTHSDEIKSGVKQEFKSLLAEKYKFTASLDEWTSDQNVRYMNVNIHSSKLQPKGFRNLGLQQIKKKGSAENCLTIYQEKLSQFGLTLEDIIGLVTDGAKVMCSLGRKTPAFHQLCYAHGIQLAVLDVLYKKHSVPEPTSTDFDETDIDTDTGSILEDGNEDMEVENEEGFIVSQISHSRTAVSQFRLVDSYKELIDKVRKIAKMFKNSPTKSELLYNYDSEGDKKGVRLILDCKTRWSSLADMISRFLLLKNAVSLIDLKSKITFTEDEINNLEEISDSLNTIKATVEAICQEDANLLTAETALKFMVRHLSLKRSRLAMDLVESLKERIAQRRLPNINGTIKYLHNPNGFYQESVVSDFPFENPSNDLIRDTIIKINHTFAEPQEVYEEPAELELAATLPSTSATAMTVKDLLRDEINRALSDPSSHPQDQEASTATLDIETKVKVEMALFDGGGKRTEYLQRAYDALLTISPTSVEAERVFSAAGYLCNHLRTRLNADSLDALSFLRSHYQRTQK